VFEVMILFVAPLAPWVRAGGALVALYGGWAIARTLGKAWAATTPSRTDLRVFAAAFAAVFFIIGNGAHGEAAGAWIGWLPVAAAALLVIGYLIGLSRPAPLPLFFVSALAASGLVIASLAQHDPLGASRLAPHSVAVALLLLSLVSPDVARPVHDFWTPIGKALLLAFTKVGLTCVYYLAVMPIGWAMRATGKDPLDRRLDPSAKTYWRERDATHHAAMSRLERYRRQF
jgi:hypothetical protein